MREYAEEGIQHFYFMMLQKDEVRLVQHQLSLSFVIFSLYQVHRCYEEWWDWALCQSQLQS